MVTDTVVLRNERGLGSILPQLLSTEMDYADVKIITADGYKILAHSCVLSTSPVLRSCLQLVDVRVSRDIIVHMEFKHPAVVALIHFLYKGCTQLSRRIKPEFTELCKTLRLNPPVIWDLAKNKSTDRHKLKEINPDPSIHYDNISEAEDDPPDLNEDDPSNGDEGDENEDELKNLDRTDPSGSEAHVDRKMGPQIHEEHDQVPVEVHANHLEVSLPSQPGSSVKNLETQENDELEQGEHLGERYESSPLPGDVNVESSERVSLFQLPASLAESSPVRAVVAHPATSPDGPTASSVIAVDVIPKHNSSLGLEPDVPESCFYCDICGRVYLDFTALLHHRASHTPGPPEEQVHSPGPPEEQVHSPSPPKEQAHSPGPPEEQVHTPGPAEEQVHSPGPPEDQVHTPGPSEEQVHSPGPPEEQVHSPGPTEERVLIDKEVSYEETPECISDFLSELNKQHESRVGEGDTEDKNRDLANNNNNNLTKTEDHTTHYLEEGTDGSEINVESSDDTSLSSPETCDATGFEFKMPENFDIPQDYIQEIVPKKIINLSPEERLANLGIPTEPVPVGRHGLNKPKMANSSRPNVEQLTYYSRETSSKSTKHNRLNTDPKFNRKRHSYVLELFGDSQESEENTTIDTPRVRKEFESCGGTATILSEKLEPKLGEGIDSVTPNPLLAEELEEKKERIKKRLMDTDSEEEGKSLIKEKRKKKKKYKEAKSPSSSSSFSHSKTSSNPSQIEHSTPSSHSKPSIPSSHSKSSSTSSHSKSSSTSSKAKPSGSMAYIKLSSKSLEPKVKAPFKFEDDTNWLVPDSFEDSQSDSERRRKERKKKKKKKMERVEEDASTEDDDRRKRLDERKQKSGGDLLAWMFRRPKLSVKFQAYGEETIVDKAIYKMHLIGDEDEESSGVEEQIKKRRREEDSLSEKEELQSKSSSPQRSKKKKKKNKKRKKFERHNYSSDEERERKKFKRSVSLQQEKKPPPPLLQRSTSTFGATSFKIPKLAKPKPPSPTK